MFGYTTDDAYTEYVDVDLFDGTLREVDIAFNFDSMVNGYFSTSCSATAADVKSVTMHEFGHFLGLGHTNDAASIMRTNLPAADVCWNMPGAPDIECVLAIYPEPPPPSCGNGVCDPGLGENAANCPGDCGGAGCKRGSLPTIALVPKGMQQDFLRLLAHRPDLDGVVTQQLADRHLAELGQIAETHQPATRAVNTFVTTHIDFVESQSTSSPEAFTPEVIEGVKTLFQTLAQPASPSLRQQLIRMERSVETGDGKTFKQMVDDVLAGKVHVGERIPEAFELVGNYPNPFNPATVIQYRLPEATHVTLEVFDATGRLVRTLVDKEQGAGIHDVVFEAADLPSGTYLYQINTAQGTRSGKMTLVR